MLKGILKNSTSGLNKTYLKSHILFIIYSILFLFLLYGVYVSSGSIFILELVLYYGVFCLFYLLFNNKSIKNKLNSLLNQIPSFSFSLFWPFMLIVIFIVLHYIFLGKVPLISAMQSNDDIMVAKIRNNITFDCPLWLNYLSSFLLKAVIPVLIVISYQKDRKYFYLLSIISAFYALSLIQKSYIITLFIPALIYFLWNNRWMFLLTCVFLAACTYFLVDVANPQISGSQVEMLSEDIVLTPNENTSNDKLQLYSYGIFKRLVITPGAMVALWFEYIPKKLPYLYGCGYHFLDPILPCQYISYSRKIYDCEHPDMVQKNIQGTCVTAHFMYDYANFGVFGLFLAALSLAIFLNIVSVIFQNFQDLVVFNLFPLLILTSSAFTTILFSHGWGLIILLYLLFIKAHHREG